MNEHDRSNLEFLLNASPEVLQDWYSKMEEDDILYAFELLQAASLELLERPVNISTDCTEARKLLSKFMLQ